MKTAIFFLNVLAAIAGFAAPMYWFAASKTDHPPYDEETGRPVGTNAMGALNKELVTASRLNRFAAGWSCTAALCAEAFVFKNDQGGKVLWVGTHENPKIKYRKRATHDLRNFDNAYEIVRQYTLIFGGDLVG